MRPLRDSKEFSLFVVVHQIVPRRVFCLKSSTERSNVDEREVQFHSKNVVRYKFDVDFRFVVLQQIFSSNIVSNNSFKENKKFVLFVFIDSAPFSLLQKQRKLTKPRRKSRTMLSDRFLLLTDLFHSFFIFDHFIERHSSTPNVRKFERFVFLFEKKKNENFDEKRIFFYQKNKSKFSIGIRIDDFS